MAVYINKREEIARVAEIGGTISASLDFDNIGLMKQTGGTVTVLQGTSPWVISGTVIATPTGTQDVNVINAYVPVSQYGTWNVGLTEGTAVVGTIDARQVGTWNVITDATSTVNALQAGIWNVNQTIGNAGYTYITDGTSTVGVTADGRLRTDAIFNVNQTSTFVWSAANVAAGDTSVSVDLREYTNVMAFVSSSNPTTITVMISPDNSIFFDDSTIRLTAVNDTAAFDVEKSGFYYKLRSSAASTITAGFMAKT